MSIYECSKIANEIFKIITGNQPPPIESLLPDLINEISSFNTEKESKQVLIIDDYHLITNQQIHKSLLYFIENIPNNLHLIISGRADPPWPLARLRAHLDLAEIRVQDLRFSNEEVRIFLKEVMRLNISPGEIKALNQRTEGWIVGLQMAALSMKNRDDISSFIESFTGNNSFILDYLLEEVLYQQTTKNREFLLKTSIFDQLNCELIDYVLERNDSQNLLNDLNINNLFLVPLDENRCWFRYHHLFSELLLNQLSENYHDQLVKLHIRASQWYEENEFQEKAISHALRSKDHLRVKKLIIKYAMGMLRQSKYNTVLDWINTLPEDIINKSQWLCIYKAWTSHWAGIREGGVEYLKTASKLVKDSKILSAEDKKIQLSYISAIDAHYSLINEDLTGAIQQAEQALADLPDDNYTRTTASIALGGGHWGKGDIIKAEQAFSDCAAYALRENFDAKASISLCYKGILQFKQARLKDTFNTYQIALRLSTSKNGRHYPSSGYVLAKMSEILTEWNNLSESSKFAEEGVVLSNELGHIDIITETYISLAINQLNKKEYQELESTINLIDELVSDIKIDPWAVTWINELRIQLWLKTNDIDRAINWIENSDLVIDGEISYHHEMHHSLLAQVMVAQILESHSRSNIKQAKSLLTRLISAAEKANWINNKIKFLVLESILLNYCRENEKSIDSLNQALILARPSDYIRTFVNGGEPIKSNLSQIQKSSSSEQNQYIDKILEAFRSEKDHKKESPTGFFIDLTNRELDVLKHLDSNETVPEIAEKMVVTTNTVRTHIKSIYNKLNVHNRISAIKKAHELKLI